MSMVSRPQNSREPASEREHFERVVTTRGSLYWADRTAAGRRRREVRAALLMAAVHAEPAWRMLEIGCGTGEYTRAFGFLTPASLVSVDVAPVLASHARTGAGPNVQTAAADVEALPFRGEAFDAITGNAVLHHLRLERALPELLRVLRPGGRFCFAEPNFLNPHVFLERTVPFIGHWLDDSPGETAFTRWGLRRQLTQLGLVEVTVRPFDFLYPLVPAPLVRAIERLGHALERTPLVAEFAGSLLITARKSPADR